MIPSVQIEGEPDTHPEHPVHDAHDLASGKVDLSELRLVRHVTRIYDLSDTEQRDEYDRLYVDLAARARTGGVVISVNSRDILTRPDGSTGWFRSLEWSEYDTSGILGM